MKDIFNRIMEIDIKSLFSEEKKRKGIAKYAEILQAFPKVDVREDRGFQKKFNGFYRVRRNVEWQKIYYSTMQQGKTVPLDFEKALRDFYNLTGRVEASFVSKLIHTLDNNAPILDAFVLQNLGKKMPLCQGERKIECAVCIYNEIAQWYRLALLNNAIQTKITEFDLCFPEYSWFSRTKKLDFLLWQMRE